MSNLNYRTCTHDDIDFVLAFWNTTTLGGSTNTRETIETYLAHDASCSLPYGTVTL